jgi:16S rRNA (cytidine1402-2'-O)-methyltransferase
MAGTLFVVATPIGHLDDITARALRVLGEVTLVAAEDTRRTGNLLRHFGLSTPILSLHAHNEGARVPDLIDRLRGGASIAVVSDAGTPGISDPGAGLVRAAREAGIRIEPIPGPSAVVTAISIAGLDRPAFCFMGFTPIKPAERAAWMNEVRRLTDSLAIVSFEAPHKLRQTIEELGCFVDYPILLFRELTKRFEETMAGTPAALLTRLEHPRGEFTIVIPRRPAEHARVEDLPESDWKAEIGRLTENGAGSRREAARALARRLGVSTRRVYDATRD